MQREAIDFVIHIPLEAEYHEFREVFQITEEIDADLNVIAKVKAPSGFTAIVIVQEKMGRSAALGACQTILGLYKPVVYVCLGIAGCLTKDLSLGDVAYTGGMIDVYDNSKVTDIKGGGVNIALSPEFYSTARRLTSSIGFVRTLSSLSDLYGFWQEDQSNFAEGLVPDAVEGRDKKLEVIRAPKCLNGDIVCGAVSESDTYRDKLKGVTRNILAIETESGPVFEQCREHGIEAITIRGMSDYANASKGDLEGETQDQVRKIAARNAATFLHMQLQNPSFISAFAALKGKSPLEPELDLDDNDLTSIPNLLSCIGDEVDVKLRELSPQYRTKPQGFKLPSPRLKSAQGAAMGDNKKKPDVLEFAYAIARHKRMTIFVPRTYPDQALPWVLAANLLSIDLAGKKAIPIVIDGHRIGPPKDGLDHLSKSKLNRNIDTFGGEYVFIINEPPLTSKTKIAHLVGEVKDWPNSRFIFLTRTDRSAVESADFSHQLPGDSFSLVDVSFAEMAAFIEVSFDLPGHEAEVVALKLKGMFNRFSLPAHPSFFAGIPPEALAALLLANRRSELIQLAVDGFLSYVVATDTASVRMSRGNRSKFMRELAVEIIFQKRSFDEAELVNYAKQVSDDYDYNLDAISFVKSFVDAGLIHFEGGKAKITLPFIESYLFADELNKNDSLAEEYLKFDHADFNLSVFDLYSEIGPSKAVVLSVIESLEEALAQMPRVNNEHILLGHTINPVVFKNPARLSNLSRKVSDARTAMADGASNRDEKVRVLDIADRVSEDVAERANAEPANDKADDAEKDVKLQTLFHNWTLATTLLGSGAESIKGNDRRRLAEAIIKSAEVLLDVILRHTSTYNFEDIKQQIIKDERFRSHINAKDDQEFEGVVSALVDLLEYLMLCDPLDRVLDDLPDRARHRIVGNSVAKASADTPIQKLIKENWLTNINPEDGKEGLLKALSELPKSQFVRASLTSIYMMRSKWKVPDMDTRLALLDAAEEAIKPFNPNMDKGEVMRFVKKHVPGVTDLRGDSDG